MKPFLSLRRLYSGRSLSHSFQNRSTNFHLRRFSNAKVDQVQKGWYFGLKRDDVRLADEKAFEKYKLFLWEEKQSAEFEYIRNLQQLAKSKSVTKEEGTAISDYLYRFDAEDVDYWRKEILSLQKDIQLQRLFLHERINQEQAIKLHYKLIERDLAEVKKELEKRFAMQGRLEKEHSPSLPFWSRANVRLARELSDEEVRYRERHSLFLQKIELLRKYMDGEVSKKELETAMEVSVTVDSNIRKWFRDGL